MKLAILSTSNGPRLVSVTGETFLDLQAADASLPGSIRELLASPNGLSQAAAASRTAAEKGLTATGDLLAPIPNPTKVVCIGLNYRDHAIESGAPIPEEPVCFNKFSSAVTGPNAPVRLPKVCTQVDYEAELVVVIGKRAKHVQKQQAMEHVAGYMNGNDVSARDWQLNKPGKQWMAGKTFDTFAPVGPVLVTRDEVPNPSALGIRLRLNGQTMQNSTTAQLIFDVPYTIAYLSKIVTLEPGDLIFTGTPPGVGMARKPQVWLKAGDVVEVEIDGLGTLSNPVVAEA